MEIAKKIFNVTLIFCTVISVIFIGVYVYYLLTDSGIYKNVTSTYVASYKDPQTGENVNPFTLNYYENYNNSGKEVIEWRINGYSDQNMNAIYGRGYQLVIDNENGNKLYYCDTYDGVSWESMHEYDETNDDGQYKNSYYVSVNDKLYAVRIDGTYTVDERKENNFYFIRNLGNAIANFVTFNWSSDSAVDYCDAVVVEQATYHYTIEEIMLKFANMIKSNSYGTGEFVLPVVDLGDYLHVYEVAEDGTVSDEPVGVGGQINSYFSVDINYDKRGMSYADQSIYGSVAGDSSFNITGIDFDVNYWMATQTYTITEEDFVSRYSSVDLGFYYSLSQELISELKTYKNLEINIVFDLDNFKNINVLGFDYYALNGIKVSSLTITSSTQRDFMFLVGSIKDTGLTTIDTTNVDIINLSGSEVA